MPPSRERVYYKALRQALTAVQAEKPLKAKLSHLARITSRCLDAGAAILVTDATGKNLVHTAHWQLPPFFVQKGLLNIEKSLLASGDHEPVLVTDIAGDARVQYPELAAQAEIAAILSQDITRGGRQLGALRVYFKQVPSLNNQDNSFIKAMAQVVGMPLSSASAADTGGKVGDAAGASGAGQLTEFAHQSEREFARMLDFYRIPWAYEPRSFPIGSKSSGAVEMFTPDFFLPDIDTYIELTTMKQSLVTQKNRKVRLFKQQYPGIKINLLYKNDYEKLLAKYGVGPLAESRAHGIKRILFTSADIERRVAEMAERVSADYDGLRPVLIGVQRGFLCFMADLIRRVTVAVEIDYMAISYYSGEKDAGVKVTKDADLSLKDRHILLVEDIVDTGITLNYILNYLKSKQPASVTVCALLDRKARRLIDTELKYIGFELPDEFVVGYGLDFHEEYRNLPYIAIPEIDAPHKGGAGAEP